MQVLDASIEIDAAAERVWDVLADTARYGEWNPLVTGVFDGNHALTVEALSESRSRFRTPEEVTGLLLPLLGKAMRQSQAGLEELCRAVKARAESDSSPRRT